MPNQQTFPPVGVQGAVGQQFANFSAVEAVDIMGMLPAFDSRVIGKPYLLEGRNVRFDVQGPYSGFGSVFATRTPFPDPALMDYAKIDFQGIKTSFLLSQSGIWAFDSISGTFYPRYLIDVDQSNPYPWSYCFVFNRYYFCTLGAGVIEYNPFTDAFTQLVSPFLPEDPCSVTDCRGRLVVLGKNYYAWSNLDNPTDFEPSLLTGANLQGTSIIGGTSMGVFTYGDGFLVHTSVGIVINESSTGVSPFTSRVLTRDNSAIGPFAIHKLDGTSHIFVSQQGLFTTSGGVPEKFDPPFSEYVARTLLTAQKVAVQTNFHLSYQTSRQMILLSIAYSDAPTVYETAWNFYRPVEKWGSFNRAHCAFIELYFTAGPYVGFQHCVVDNHGYIHILSEPPYIEQITFPDNGVDFHTDADIPARVMDGVYYMPVYMNITDRQDWMLEGFNTGWYDIGVFARYADPDTEPDEITTTFDGTTYFFGSLMSSFAAQGIVGPIPNAATAGGLDSYIKVGLFRWWQGQDADEMGLLTALTIGQDDETDSVILDYMHTDEPDEDWNTMEVSLFAVVAMPLAGENPNDIYEDWGINVTVGSQYQVILFGTNDGRTTYIQEVPTLAAGQNRNKLYTCLLSGRYHIVQIYTAEANDNYHLKYLEPSGTYGGRV